MAPFLQECVGHDKVLVFWPISCTTGESILYSQ
jgi:hypothetical protein